MNIQATYPTTERSGPKKQ
jgi:hypothetical protein